MYFLKNKSIAIILKWNIRNPSVLYLSRIWSSKYHNYCFLSIRKLLRVDRGVSLYGVDRTVRAVADLALELNIYIDQYVELELLLLEQ